MSELNFKVTEFEVNSGDAILILSDGLPELFNSNNEYYSYKQVQSELLSTAAKPNEEIIENFKRSALKWTDNVAPIDDVTFIVIKIK
jgi:serine phosphatase RsbU (regulator of sigma subunit)